MNASDKSAGRAHGRLAFAMLFWGAQVPALYVMLETWNVFWLSAARYVLASTLLIALLAWREGLPRLGPDAWARVAVLGTVGIATLATLLTIGLSNSDPVTAIVLQTAGPVVATLIARFLYRAPLARGTFVALVLAVGGGLLTMWPKFKGAGGPGFRGGEILLLLGSFCWSWYSIACQRWLPGFSQLRITTLTLAAGAVVVVLILLVVEALGLVVAPPRPPDAASYALLVFMTVTSTCLGILLWHGGVRDLGLPTASLYLNLQPVIGVLVTVAVGVVPYWEQLAGGVLVILGILQLRLWQPTARDGA
ncbi:MAG: DMT family transporter [Proteobacteria bacterium]|nr:DMT family transporter [Pseudomonadota bacterium]